MKDEDQTQFQGTRDSIERMVTLICEEEIIINVSFRDVHDGDGGRSLLMLSYDSAYDDSGLFLSAIPISTPSDDNAASAVAVRPLIYQMSSAHTFHLAHSTLHDCMLRVGSHETCPKFVPSAFPTRVLDCQNPSAPKLKVNVGGIEDCYVALSYVWGEDQPQRTVKANVEKYISRGLDMDVTPQTIKDAIRVTCELHVRYLWIDTYCIIQDSPEDKAREIGNMRRIYQNAYFTIIAAKTPKVSLGFLQDCPPPFPTYRVPFYCPDGALGTMTLAPRAMYNLYDANQEPINTRGWCFQEYILAPRAFIYASHTIQYLCQRGLIDVGNDSFPDRMAGMDRLPPRFFNRDNDTYHDPNILTPAQLRELTKLWHRILQFYTPRGLSAPEDKLNAISGVADEFHRVLNSRYIAGMWEHHLLGDLLWTRSSEEALPGPSIYRAPSWSWAAANGVIYNPGPVVEPDEAYHCVILDCKVELANEHSLFGELSRGYLKLRARMKQTIWNSSRGLLYEPAADGKLTVVGGGYPDRQEGSEGSENVWALPMVLTVPKPSVFSRSREEGNTMRGMLLKVAETKPDCYRRVGLFRCTMQGSIEEGFENSAEQIITII
ncbi:uncharacterized protein FIBRA_03482 [Fibroporia radiculosa]|uniref:Heterokaryon incompatibility domain-containing protein n=1 Tax=Fibroporia radiculosa TaxID=599839 RepID=J4GNI1_9APHY|nr:uncharacterized protein FIBRA_03482 [Fibroporia radiculosa]CCM01430.1 predicted protein [Fibroporia radiculosa]